MLARPPLCYRFEGLTGRIHHGRHQGDGGGDRDGAIQAQSSSSSSSSSSPTPTPKPTPTTWPSTAGQREQEFGYLAIWPFEKATFQPYFFLLSIWRCQLW